MELFMKWASPDSVKFFSGKKGTEKDGGMKLRRKKRKTQKSFIEDERIAVDSTMEVFDYWVEMGFVKNGDFAEVFGRKMKRDRVLNFLWLMGFDIVFERRKLSCLLHRKTQVMKTLNIQKREKEKRGKERKRIWREITNQGFS